MNPKQLRDSIGSCCRISNLRQIPAFLGFGERKILNAKELLIGANLSDRAVSSRRSAVGWKQNAFGNLRIKVNRVRKLKERGQELYSPCFQMSSEELAGR
jgi:hypothetical protein